MGKWRRRFQKDRIDGLLDQPRPGRPRSIEDDRGAEVIRADASRQAGGRHALDATHWSIRSMAKEAGFSHTTIRRIWTAFGLQPHRDEHFKLSTDPPFVDKVRDIVGFVSLTTQPGFGLERRREESDPGAGPLATGSSHDARGSRTPDPRRCPPWQQRRNQRKRRSCDAD